MKTVYLNEHRKLTKRKIKKISKKIEKLSKKEEIVVAMSENIMDNSELKKEIEDKNVHILDGRWIFKFFLFEIICYIAERENEKFETLNVAILIDEAQDIVFPQIAYIARSVKSLKIITPKSKRFTYMESKLYTDYGVAIQITNNKEKALANAKVIINYDFDEEMISKYELPSSGTIVNIKYKINADKLMFSGNVINYYKIKYSDKVLDAFDDRECFDDNVLYESLVYRSGGFSSVRKLFERDEVILDKLM